VIEQPGEDTGPYLRCDLFTSPLNPGNYVAQVEIPAFKKGQRPQVLIWGDRTFVFHSHQSPRNFPNPAYVEAFAVVALRTVEEPAKQAVGNAELDAGAANHYDPEKRGFSPK
jgi:hypothetical protein